MEKVISSALKVMYFTSIFLVRELMYPPSLISVKISLARLPVMLASNITGYLRASTRLLLAQRKHTDKPTAIITSVLTDWVQSCLTKAAHTTRVKGWKLGMHS